MINSYSSIYNLGHRELKTLFNDAVVVQEKLDGSQFSFSKTLEGELTFRSKGVRIMPDENCPKMFIQGVAAVKKVETELVAGWTYRGEYFQKPKHNTLSYSRIPNNHIAVFDIDKGDQDYLDTVLLDYHATRLGFEVVPVFFNGKVYSAEDLFKFMDYESFLGGPKIEGIVIKSYSQLNCEKKVLMGKHVSEAFKETHQKQWKLNNPQSGDILQQLTAVFKNEARWQKAVQRLRDDGQLTDSPKDIGALIASVKDDIVKECADDIKEKLWSWARDHILRGSTGGLPEWYKNKLVEVQFEGVNENNGSE